MEPLPDESQDKLEFALAELPARFGSRFIDFVFLVVFYFVMALLATSLGWVDLETAVEDTGTVSADAVLLFYLTLGSYALYEISMIARRGQTVGKIVTKTKVITVDGADPPGWRAASVRWALAWLAVAVLGVLGLVVLIFVLGWGMFDANRQGLHDKVARTYVVRVEAPDGL